MRSTTIQPHRSSSLPGHSARHALCSIGALCATLALILSACGSTSTGAGLNANASSGVNNSKLAQTFLSAKPTSLAGVSHNLRVEATFTCFGFDVLANSPTSYSAHDIQTMRTAWKSNGFAGIQVMYSGVTSNQHYPCMGSLEVTNIGASAVNIIGGGVQLTKAPITNSFQFHLISICDPQYGLAPDTCFGHGHGPSCIYYLNLPLTQGQAGVSIKAAFQTTAISNTTDCPPTITLHPGDSAVEIDMYFSSKSALIYQLIPELSLIDSTGKQQIVTFPSIQAHAAYAAPQQFSCFGVVKGRISALPTSASYYPGANKLYQCQPSYQ